MNAHDWLNTLATLWFFGLWIGYANFARRRAKISYSLSSVLQIYRKRWMQAMLRRENRIGDAALIASLERQTTFLASTSIFIIAGLVTVLASSDQIYDSLVTLPFVKSDITQRQLQFKILLLLAIYVYAFFTLTWGVRQYGFSSILLGAAPLFNDPDVSEQERFRYATHSAKVIDLAGHSYNYGLRAYYFSLAVLPWVFNTWLFILSTTLTVAILYRREFHSRPLQTMTQPVREAR